jgi:2-oxoglutarate/2-oxoacid ferredoxin oxidoreductase subunit alpha
MNTTNPFRIKLLGTAGDGIISTADIIMQAASYLGYYSTVYKSVPSSIRIGNTFSLISISPSEIRSPIGLSDLIFFVRPSVEFEQTIQEFADGGTIFANESIVEIDSENISKLTGNKTFTFLTVPFSTLSQYSMSATLLGILSKTLEIPLSIIIDSLLSRYSNRATFVDNYTTDLKKGYSWAVEHQTPVVPLSRQSSDQQVTILDGNQAICQGAIAADCRFFASYPITPATTIGDTLAHLLPQLGGIAYQAEDEIAALGAVTGSSFSGVKSMSATSGPGFSLMQEFISYLSTVELPAVIVNVMRAGPSTGLPTRHGQEDLLPAVFGGHGEDQRIVLAPTSISDCYHVTIDAFNCAEQYACPVILLSDYAFAFTKFTLPEKHFKPIVDIINRKMTSSIPPQKTFSRYSNDNCIFPELPSPGLSNSTYRITGLEHDQNSQPSENIIDHQFQLCRRFKKSSTIENAYAHLIEWDLEEPIPYKADFCIIAWSFDVLSVKEAVIRLRKKQFKVAGLYPKLLFPVCIDALKKLNEYSQTIILPESNFSGQFAALIRMYSDIHPISLTNTTCQPILPELLEIQIENIIAQRVKNART